MGHSFFIRHTINLKCKQEINFERRNWARNNTIYKLCTVLIKLYTGAIDLRYRKVP